MTIKPLDMYVLLLSTAHTQMGVGLCGTQTPEYGTHTVWGTHCCLFLDGSLYKADFLKMKPPKLASIWVKKGDNACFYEPDNYVRKSH